MIRDSVSWRSLWTVRRFVDERAWRRGIGVPYSKTYFRDNVALNEGLQQLIEDAILGTGGLTKWNNANARLGVGDSSAAEAPTQVGLQGATSFKGMDATYPQRISGQTARFRSTFQSTEGNQSWQEFTADNGAAAGINLNRKVSNQGSKVSGQVWELTLDIALS